MSAIVGPMICSVSESRRPACCIPYHLATSSLHLFMECVLILLLSINRMRSLQLLFSKVILKTKKIHIYIYGYVCHRCQYD